jgi:opacity protein-like surface antigen
MRRSALFAASLLAVLAAGTAAEAQQSYHVNGPLRLNVRPRSWLELGNTVSAGSSVNPASAYGQQVSYQLSPPWNNMRDRFGEGTLPDPVTNGPFVGATNPFGPVDYGNPGF